MNQQLLEFIYLKYQPDQYYKQYLIENKIRSDSRQFAQHRPLRISISPSTISKNKASKSSCTHAVTVSRGSTIVIAQLNTNIEQVIYSPISDSYGKQLIGITVSANGTSTGRYAKSQRNEARAIQNYISQFINWRQVQNQIVFKAGEKGIFAHVGDISLRVADQDGCLEQTALLAVQLLLWTVQFTSIQHTLFPNNNTKPPQLTSIELSSFYFPIKYCQILNKLILDPTSDQQSSSSYQLTLISNIRSKTGQGSKPYRILQVHKNKQISQEQLKAIQKLYMEQLSKLALDLSVLKNRCVGLSQGQGGNGQVILTIDNL